MLQDCFIAPFVSRRALQNFFDAFSSGTDEIHAIELYDHGELVLRIAPSPYRADDKREVYSLSKSFCSTAIGILCDAGRLSVEERIVDIFPDRLPEQVSENLSEMRLRHVLSMNTGHAGCVMNAMIHSDDPVKCFMAQDIPYRPGTHFAYNTGATLLLSCIVEKVSGKKLLDFLTETLFTPLGISGMRWNQVPTGQNEGGVGLHISCDDIAKLGLLYLNGGVWKGRRLLSETWIKEAGTPISDNSCNGTPDWCAGYGYQFWCNAGEGFRGDGAFGQLCMILPQRQMVIAVQAEVSNMQAEVDAVMTLVEHLYDRDEGQALVLPVYAPSSSRQRLTGFQNTLYRLEKNPMGWNTIGFAYDTAADALQVLLSDGMEQQILLAGNGYWAESTLYAKKLKPKLVDLMSTPLREPCRISSSYSIQEGVLSVLLRYRNCPHRMTLTVKEVNQSIEMTFSRPERLDADAAVLKGYPATAE